MHKCDYGRLQLNITLLSWQKNIYNVPNKTFTFYSDQKSFQLGFAVSPKIAVSMRLAPYYRPKLPVSIWIVFPTQRKLKYGRFLPKKVSRTLLCTFVRTHPSSLLYPIRLWHMHGVKWSILQLTDNYKLQQRIYEKFRVGSCSGNIVRTYVH